MLYRLATVGIVAFWLVMMGLLVRLETHPEATGILEVPVSYVARLIFKHAQESRLEVYDLDKRAGSVSVRPSITPEGQRALGFSGSVSIQLPLASRQRYSFSGQINMDAGLRVTDFHGELAMPEPHYRILANGDTALKMLHYEIREGRDHVAASQDLPMDARLIGPQLLQNMGISLDALPIPMSGIAPPVVTARETQITMHAEQLQVYEVLVSEGASQLIEVYVTQVGQIVMAKTNFGYTLSTEE